MRTSFVIAVLIALGTPALAADMAGLPPEMWGRIHAIEAVPISLQPTPSPEAPARLSLREAVGLAFRHNASFRQAQAELVDARTGFWVADQRLFYTVSGEATRERSPGGLPQTSLVAGLGTRWESLSGGTVRAAVATGSQEVLSGFFTQRPSLAVSYDQPLIRGAGLASSTYERIRGARTALASQELSFYDAHQALAQQVIGAYTAALLAKGEVDIAQRSVDRAKQYYQTNYGLFYGKDLETGEPVMPPDEEYTSQVPGLDVDQARLDWERSKQELISRQQAYRDAVDRLLLAMGLLPGATPELTTVITYTPQEYDETALVETALANSTDLGRLTLSRQDAEAALRIARSEDRPDLLASVGVTDLGETLGGQTVSTGWFGGVRVEAPLLERGREEDVARAQRDLEVLQQRVVATRDQVTQEILRQVRAAASSRARIDIGEQSVALAKKNREAAQEMQAEGLTDSLRVLDAESRLVQAERSLLGEQTDYFVATVQIRVALGEDITHGLPE